MRLAKMNKPMPYSELATWLGYILLALITTFPLIRNMGALFGPPEDNQLFVWNIWWFKYAVFHLGISPFHTDYLFWPDGTSLLFHTFSPLNGMLGGIFGLIMGTNATYNFLILMSFVLSGYFMFMLCRKLGLSRAASFIAGLIFSFCPFHLVHAAHHLNISSIYLMPLILLFVLKGAETGKIKYAALAALFLATSFYLSYYVYLITIFLILPLMAIQYNRGSGNNRIKFFGSGMIVLALSTVLIAPLFLPMVKEAYSSNFERAIGHDLFVTDLVGFFFPHKYHWTHSSYISWIVNESYAKIYWESAAFLGYLVLPMAIWAAIKKKIPLKKYFILIGLLGAILSLGSYPHLFGRPISFIKLPVWLFEHIPLLNAARSPSRFVVLTYLALAVFAAYAAEAWFDYLKVRWGKSAYRMGIVGLSAAIMLDYWSAPFEMADIQIPDYYNTIKADKDECAIMNLPMEGWENNERYMYYQTVHNKPICGGQLARSSSKYFDDFRKMAATEGDLIRLKVKYIILHKAFTTSSEYQKMHDFLIERFELFADDNLGTVFRTYR